MDETSNWNQFPVLADFETRFETDRWTGDADSSTAFLLLFLAVYLELE